MFGKQNSLVNKNYIVLNSLQTKYFVNSMSFPNKETRTKCYDARDKFWQCMDNNSDNSNQCTQVRKLFEDNCPSQWVTHFDRKREFEKYKRRVDSGYEPIDENKANK